MKDDNRLGPSLYGVVGRKAGSLEPATPTTQSLKDSGVTWDEPTLDKWIANPGAVIPGNDMSPPYGGVADAAITQADHRLSEDDLAGRGLKNKRRPVRTAEHRPPPEDGNRHVR